MFKMSSWLVKKIHQEGIIVAVTEIVAEDMAYQEKIIFCVADIWTLSTFFILVSDKNWENTQAP